MSVYFRVLQESFGFAINALKANKLRTILSLLGVTFGIFSIVAILAAVDSLTHEVTGQLDAWDSKTIFLSKMSFSETSVPKWKRDQFKNVSYDDYITLKRTSSGDEIMSYTLFTPFTSVRYQDRIINSVRTQATTYDFPDVESIKLSVGRFYNEYESSSGAYVIVLGYDIALELFEDVTLAIDKPLRLMGKQLNVIGVLEKEGEVSFGQSKDNLAYMPVNFARNIYGKNTENLVSMIVVRPNSRINYDDYLKNLELRTRQVRSLSVNDENDFFINELSGFSDIMGNITKTLNTIGFIISGFSLLVGGFGIANIMFVSVKERTNLIGIQKSLGAKNRFILTQFLFEAIILSLLGGFIGILLVFLCFSLLNIAIPSFEFILSSKNVLIGIFISSLIGFVSGILPALSASKLNPVEAIRTGM